MERTCKKCGETKPIEEFTISKSIHEGKPYATHYWQCKECRKTVAREKYNSNLEESREKQRKRWVQNRDKLVKEKRERRERNKQKYIEIDRKWNEANRDKRRNQIYKYREKYPDRIKKTAKKNRDKDAKEISDTYVKKIINRNYDIKYKTIPKELIESYRKQIEIKRLLKIKKHENTETS